ncbi:TPA: radical SAM protein [Candidatus Gastranaerophilales bacterium HUM_20]|nr:putative uncharacterized protein [Clostridium sp. CAG:729]DAB19952.1 MAG TPA: radical SAM protein [Candidatus Gastranaerophilales bacterium HUM_20]
MANTFIQNIFSVKNDKMQKNCYIFGIKISFLSLKKAKYIIYRRYLFPIIRNDLIHSILHKKNFINYIFVYNHNLLRIRKRVYWYIALFRFLFNKKLDIPVMDFNLTTRCTLRCEQCGSMMPFYSNEQQWTTTFEDFQCDLDKLLTCVNKIHKIKLIGGEPLLVRDLDKILEYILKKKQVQTVEITTNGTIEFSQKLLKIMAKNRKKIIVVMSNYSSNKNLTCFKYDKIKLALDINRIDYLFPNYPWYLRGKIYRRNRSIKGLRSVFKKCWQKNCIALMDGKFHHCTRSVAVQRLTDYEFGENENIDIRQNSSKKIIKFLKTFYLKDYFKVCDFCVTPSVKRIPRAVQTSELQKIGDK